MFLSQISKAISLEYLNLCQKYDFANLTSNNSKIGKKNDFIINSNKTHIFVNRNPAKKSN